MSFKKFLSSVGAAASVLVTAGPASAEDDVAAKAPGAGPSCVLTGSSPVKRGAELHSAATGGKVLGSFTGAIAPLKMTDIPATPSDRAKLSTTENGGTLRIDGYVTASDVSIFTKQPIAAVGQHVWIAPGQEVKLIKAAPGKLTVERKVAGTKSQTVKATADCDAFALEPGTPSASEIEGPARAYMTKNSTITFYDKPNGDAVFTLNLIEGAGQLFMGKKASAGFIQLEGRGDLMIEGWARWKDLDPLPPGEMADRFIPPYTQVTGAKLKLQDNPPLMKATDPIDVRAERDAKAKPVGQIESGATVYVMETIAGWTNVLPEELYITPPDTGGFWIPAGVAPSKKESDKESE